MLPKALSNQSCVPESMTAFSCWTYSGYLLSVQILFQFLSWHNTHPLVNQVPIKILDYLLHLQMTWKRKQTKN